jgi:antibiotic biosynthesis monooxygenase (ABM) superfamily enzyme
MAAAADRVLELVVFRLNEGVSREELLATVDDVSAWAAEQPGFISRDLVHDAEGDRWIEVIWWRTLKDAKAAAERAMTSARCAPMFALIDAEASLMAHGEPAIAPVRA